MNEIILFYLIMNLITIITIVLVLSFLLDRRHLMSQEAELRLTELLKTDIKLTEQHKTAIEGVMTQQVSVINLMIKSIDTVNMSIQTTFAAITELTRAIVQGNQDIQIIKDATEKARIDIEKTRTQAELMLIEAGKARVEAETIRSLLVAKHDLIQCQQDKEKEKKDVATT